MSGAVTVNGQNITMNNANITGSGTNTLGTIMTRSMAKGAPAKIDAQFVVNGTVIIKGTIFSGARELKILPNLDAIITIDIKQ